MTTGRKWRVAVAGLGWVAERVHLPYLAASTDMDLLGAFDLDHERQEEITRRWGVRAYPSLEALLGSGAEVLFVCTPPRTHAALTHSALRRGIHVVCEKPLAPSGAEARAIAEHAGAVGRHVFCCMTNRFRSDVRRLRAEVQAGTIGKPRLVA